MKFYAENIEKQTLENENFRKVVFTGKYSQLVLMSIKPGDEIGTEVHETHDQFIRVESGIAKFIINDEVISGEDGFAVVIPAGASHNVISSGDSDLRLYTIYSPAEHPAETVQATKEDAFSE